VHAGHGVRVNVVELRQYTVKPGRRDELVDVFSTHLIEPQEEVGAAVLGHFRDLDRPDRFVWLRGFRDMATRRVALETFYTSDVWRRHREAVNATLIDSDDVFLLRPSPGWALADVSGANVIVIRSATEPIPDDTATSLAEQTASSVRAAGGELVAVLATEPSENDFPGLPVREGENVLVSIARFDDLEGLDAWLAHSADAAHVLRLGPAARSRVP
jgi:quinol monooxygenase YgiN